MKYFSITLSSFKLMIAAFILIALTFQNSCTFRDLSVNETTLIFLRHAEKDTSGGANPPLTVEGNQRAESLSSVFPNVIPDEFYSTDFARTISTLTPWAKQTEKDIKIYDAKEVIEFGNMLKQQTGKTIVVAGHSNTIPLLVNYIIGQQKYRLIPDGEYRNIYVVKIKNGKTQDIILKY